MMRRDPTPGMLCPTATTGPHVTFRAMRCPAQYWGAAWELAEAPQGPLSLRVTDDKGNQVSVHFQLRRVVCSGRASCKTRQTAFRSWRSAECLTCWRFVSSHWRSAQPRV